MDVLPGLDAELAKYTGKPLDQRSVDEKAEIARLSEEKWQLHQEEKQLHQEEKQLRETKLELLKRQNRAPMKELKLDLVPLERKLHELGLHMVDPVKVRLPSIEKARPRFGLKRGGWRGSRVWLRRDWLQLIL